MLARYPKALEHIPTAQLHHAGKSVVAWFRQADEPGREEGFLTENTLVFILRGTKHMHLADGDLIAHAGDLVLLKRGVYFMTDLITDGVDYQSLMRCMDDPLLRSFLPEDASARMTLWPKPAGPMVVTCEIPRFYTFDKNKSNDETRSRYGPDSSHHPVLRPHLCTTATE